MTNQTLKQKRDGIMKMWKEWFNDLLSTDHGLTWRRHAAAVVAQSLVVHLDGIYDNSHLDLANYYFKEIQHYLIVDTATDPRILFDRIHELKEFIEAAKTVTYAFLHERYPAQMRKPIDMFNYLD